MSSDDTLASRLRSKLESGEISQLEYDELYKKFTSLGILDKNSSHRQSGTSVTGSGTNRLKGGKVNGNVNLHGNVEVENSLECDRLSVTGTVNISGDLTILETAIVSGEMIINGNAKFVDKIVVTGRLQVHENMYSFNTTSLSGKTTITGDLITEGKTLLSNTFSCDNIRSTGIVRINSKLNIQGDILADRLEIEGGKIQIGGSIKAKDIKIFSRLRESSTDLKPEMDPVDTVGELLSNVVNVVFPTLIESVKGIFDTNPSVIVINENIEGDNVDISSATVNGDIIADEVVIGPKVIVNGIIQFRKSIEAPPNHNYKIEKIE